MMKLEEIGTRARQAEPVLRIMETEKKNRVLKKAAENLVADAETIIAANALDMEHGKEKGMSQGLLDRLFLDKSRIEAMAEGMCQVSELDDPIGEVLGMKKRPNGLLIGQKRVPLGVVGAVFKPRQPVRCLHRGITKAVCIDHKIGVLHEVVIFHAVHQRERLAQGKCRRLCRIIGDRKVICIRLAEAVRQRDLHARSGKGLCLFRCRRAPFDTDKPDADADDASGNKRADEDRQPLVLAAFAIGGDFGAVVAVKPKGVAGGRIKFVFAGKANVLAAVRQLIVFAAITLAQAVRDHEHLCRLFTDGKGLLLAVFELTEPAAGNAADLGVPRRGVFYCAYRSLSAPSDITSAAAFSQRPVRRP